MAIIGDPFNEYVADQISIRQQALGTGLNGSTIPLKVKQSFLTASPFMRLASAVRITEGGEEDTLPGTTVLQQIRNLGLFDGIDESEWVDFGLAKNFVLSGVANNEDNTRSPRGAVGTTVNPSVSGPQAFNRAYGYGFNKFGISSRQGYVPPPGVTSVDFEYKNDGALAQATVNIKAFSAEQFAMIDILYMRPGYTCLLEFGHTAYLNNNSELTYLDSSSTGPLRYLFNTGENFAPNFGEMALKIQKEKELKNGNYEGFFGRITKFNWKFNQDGSYDITVKLTGTGDVIASINSLQAKELSIPFSIKSSFEVEMQGPKADFSTPPSTDPPSGNGLVRVGGLVLDKLKSGVQTVSGSLVNAASNVQAYFDSSIVSRSDIATAEEEGSFVISNAFKSQLNYDLYALFADNDLAPFDSNSIGAGEDVKVFDLPLQKIPVGTSGQKISKTIKAGLVKIDPTEYFGEPIYSPSTLVKFGALLAMIQKNCNIVDKKNNILLRFEIVEDLFSSSPLENDDSFMITYPGNFSANPNSCLIKYVDFDQNTFTQLSEPDIPKLKVESAINSILHKSPNTGAVDSLAQNKQLIYRLSDVYVNVNLVATVLNQLSGEGEQGDVTVPVLGLIDNILDGINSSLGGLNNFRTIYNEDEGVIQILSESPIISTDKVPPKKKRATINTFGFEGIGGINNGSFVTNLNLNSELSDQMATQITIGAQANGNTLNGDSSTFSAYSKGLIDNLMVEKLSPLEVATEGNEKEPELTVQEQIQKVFKETRLLNNFLEIYDDLQFDEGDIVSTLESNNSQISSLVSGLYYQKKESPAPFFLPFNLGIEMHGLGGMKIYNSFLIDGKGLPLSYNPKQIRLIISSLSHNVSVDGWKTKISTISTPLSTVTEGEYKQGNQNDPKFTKGSGGSGGSTGRKSGNDNRACEERRGDPYSVTAGGVYPILKTYKFSGSDPTKGIKLQGKPISSFSRVMKSSTGEVLPKEGYGVARKLFQAVEIIGNEATKQGLTLNINSHYRGPVKNCQVGGVKNSMHMVGGAIDLGTTNPKKLNQIILGLISKGKIPEGGVGTYNSFIHYDIRGKKPDGKVYRWYKQTTWKL